jgi:phage-related protein
MTRRFEVVFLEEADQFLTELAPKVREKILYTIKLAQLKQDRDLFKKLTDSIWEFRTQLGGNSYRMLAFWDKTRSSDTLVVATHGFVKKSEKTPKGEIRKAEKSRERYFENS